MLIDVEVKTPQIAAVLKQVDKIAHGLRDNVACGEYGLVISDDFSGRIPALIFSRAINIAHNRRGKAQIPTLFLHKDYEWDFLTCLKKQENHKKALIVTEAIFSGSAIGIYGSFLQKAGFRYDVAALVAQARGDFYKERNIIHSSSSVITGEENTATSPLSDRYDLIGLKLVADGGYTGAVSDNSEESQLKLKQTNEDVEVVAKQVADILSSS
jgi:hypothetical protein